MVPLYLICFLMLFIGIAVWWNHSNKVNLVEAIAGFAITFVLTLIFNLVIIFGMVNDIETWSGEISSVEYHPKWVAEWREAETRTDSKGNTYTVWVTKSRTHHPYWVAKSQNLGYDFRISDSEYNEIKMIFGNNVVVDQPRKPDFDRGDRNVYYVSNETSNIVPVNITKMWENKVKSSPSLFAFPKVDKDVPVFTYPKNRNWRVSDRLVGTAKDQFSISELDKMNARLGPYKKVNVIIVGFSADTGIEIGQQQESKWIGGKKNDLVICYGGGSSTEKPKWTYVFGWTDKDIVKRNLETILLSNNVGNDLLPDIETEISKNYEIKDWSDFDYISTKPPTWMYVVFFVVMSIALGFYWFWAVHNEF